VKNLNRKMKSEKKKSFYPSITAQPIFIDCVELQFFLTNTPSKQQPMGQGVIEDVKHIYWKEVVSRYMDDILIMDRRRALLFSMQ